MSYSSIIGLINNAALLLALCLLYDMLGFSFKKRKTLMEEIISAVVLGAVGVAIMSNPWNFGEGVVFDTRSVLLAVSGFFFGAIPVAVAMLFTGVFRFFSGGAGMWTGIGVILTSGIIGLLWRHLRPPKHEKPSLGELYLLGMVVHLAMIAWFFLLPWPLAIDVLGKISLPVMLIYPLAVVILGKLLVMSDQRRQAEQDLKESEERYRELVESANSIILRRDREGRISFVNEFAQRFFGYSAEEILGKNVVGTIVPETDSAGRDLGKMIREISLCPQDYMTNENENILRNGRRVRITWTNKPILDASGEVAEILCVGNDVTEQRQAEEAAREATLKMQEVVRAANVGLWEWDLATNGTRFSAEWKRQIGYEEHEIADSFAEWESRVHPDDLAPTLARIQAAIEAKEPQYQVEFRFRYRDGSYRWIMASSSVIVDHNGEAVRVMGSHIDITERKVAEKERERLQMQLTQAQKMEAVGQLAGGVAHDFNNMLGVIIGYSELILAQMPPYQQFHAELEEIQKAARHSADLTRQLLTFARKQTVAPKVLDLNQTIEGMLNMLRRLIGENINLIWMPGSGLWSIKIDPSQIDQILANLCVNARDAIAGVGKITVETGNTPLSEEYCVTHAGSKPGEYVRIAVSDSGNGMDAETLAHIFEPFFTTKSVGEGTGLGLATVYGAVKQNDGFINASSEPGWGTTFTIYIPRYRDNVLPAARTVAGDIIPSGTETILVVEDEPMILKMTVQMLVGQGYHVLAAASPWEAIRLVKENIGSIDLLMTDIIMPEMNGRDLVKQLITISPNIKCLFMSGYTASVIAHHGVLDEGVHFIQKPFSMSDLGGKLREALKG